MLEDNNNRDYKEFSFIQEQITSKKKCKAKKMLFSVLWTITLACIFGIVAGVAFCVSEPTIYKLLGKGEDKRKVEFPSTSPEDINVTEGLDKTNTLPGSSGDQIVQPGQWEDENKNDEKDVTGKEEESETIIIEKYVNANLKDLTSIYTELRGISNQLNKSLVTIQSISNEIDWFKNEFELAKTTTGLVVADNGAELLILASYDKIKDAQEIQVTLIDSTKISARLQSYDKELNLAILAIKLEDIPKSQLDYIQIAHLGESYLATVGTPILALGAPNGYVGSLEFGIISSKMSSVYITDNKVDVFHTDITYNENSEGIISNLNGEVIGIITQSLMDEENKNVSTIIGISKIKKIIERLVNNTDEAYFGIKAEDMTDAALEQLEISNGIYVTEIQASSPGLSAGLQIGDVIQSINDTSVLSVQSFHNMITMHEPKTSIKVLVRRTSKSGSKDMELTVTLGKKID